MEAFTKKLLDNQQRSLDLMNEVRAKLRQAKSIEDIRRIQAEYKKANQKLWNEFDKIRP